MSVHVRAWVAKQPIKPSAMKFVLMGLADVSSDYGIAFPSIAHLEQYTCQDRKTILSNLKKLQQAGFIVDTGDRVGRTGQVIVYRIKGPKAGTVKESQKRDASEKLASQAVEGSQINEGPQTEQSQKRDSLDQTVPNLRANSTVSPDEQSQFSLQTVPNTGHVSDLNHSEEPFSNHSGLQGQPGRSKWDEEFKKIREAYPKRYGNPRWTDALHAYRARRREGVTHETILEGTYRYREFCEAEGKINTEGVMQARTFLGTNRSYKEDWDVIEKPTTASKLKWRPGQDEATNV